MTDEPTTSCLIAQGAEVRVREALNRLLDDAATVSGADRRVAVRAPYFGPVSITVGDADYPRFSAFARDISHLGVGLLHVMPLACGEVVIQIPSQTGGTVRVRTQVMWCMHCGEGWYTSGGRFLDILPAE